MLKPKPMQKLNMRKLKQKRTVVVYAPVRAHYHDLIKICYGDPTIRPGLHTINSPLAYAHSAL